jgi:hypothetical protein
MTIIDFPTKGLRSGRRSAAHPAARMPPPGSASAAGSGSAPTGAWLDAYEQLAACCAEVVATSRPRLYDAEWEDLLSWIRSRLAVLDDLKAEVTPLGAS